MERQAELVGLFHLPVYAFARRVDQEWRLGIMKLSHDPQDMKNAVYTTRDVAAFTAENKSYRMLAVAEEPHESVFVSGARFFPLWKTDQAARSYRRRLFVAALYNRIRKVDAREAVKLARERSHNYLCIQEAPDTWECIIVNDHLMVDLKSISSG